MLQSLHKKLRSREETVFDVVGVGECSRDDVWVLTGPFSFGQKIRAERHEQLGGGQVATAMVACARLGLRSAFAGSVGADEIGDEVRSGLISESVDVRALRVVADAHTRSALLLVDGGSGDRTVIESMDPHLRRSPLEVDVSVLDRTRVLHLDLTDLTAATLLSRAAKTRGVIVSLDLDHPRPGLDELLPFVDICVTSRDLPEALTGERDLGAALKKLHERTGGFVGCTLGADGAAALDVRGEESRLIFSPAPVPARLVDTTACGDTFHAAMILALIEGLSVADALRFCNAAASLKCRDLGRRGCPTRAEVEALIQSQ